MENGSNVSAMLDDEINIMFTDWPMTKDMVIKGTPPPSFFLNECIVLQTYIFQHIQIDFVCVCNRNG